MSTWIVLPTYNEAETITEVVASIRARTPADILIVDDASPDGTGKIVEQLRNADLALHILHRAGKMGLGTAYQAGFRYALTQGADVVVQMDADGSHDPALIPLLIGATTTHDLALGSRYVPGGRFPIAWYRRWISTLGNVYIRLLLGWSIRDWSTGYKAWRGDFLRRVMQQPMRGVGYAWLLEMTWLALRLHGRVIEIPLVFRERGGGASKFSWRIATEDIRLAWTLFRQR